MSALNFMCGGFEKLSVKIAEQVAEKLMPTLLELGYELVDVEYVKKGDDATMTIYIDIPSGITLDDCERAHNVISPMLDELNPTSDAPYTLNVSSPGLDRAFVRQRDYERNYGKEVELKLFAPRMGKKHFEGVLKEKTPSTITITTESGDITIEANKVAYTRPLVRF